jgi:hypothetical protein
MLQLALAALLVGAPLTAADPEPPIGDKDKAPRTEASVGIFKADVASDEAIVNDTYSFGIAQPTFLKVWLGYAWGQVDERYDQSGNQVGIGTLQSHRGFVGAQADFINLGAFRVGVGGQIMIASSNYENVVVGMVGNQPIVRSGDTGFGLQNGKVYAHARGHAVGVHGGYIFDLGEEGDTFPTSPERSDLRHAIFVGGDFDYPARNFRLFGGIDYFMLQDRTDVVVARDTNDDLLVFNMGAGIRFWIAEVGAAALIRTTVGGQPPGRPGAGHQGSIAPYLRLSPPQIPVSISVKGAVTDEYADYGFSIGGRNKPVTQLGFTVAATYGF